MIIDEKDGKFKVNCLKCWLDGTFGARTACMFEPFSDQQDKTPYIRYMESLQYFFGIEVNSITFKSSLIESELKKIAEKLGINLRKVAEVVRIALWGAKVSPPLFGTMEILGRTETLNRLKAYSKNF